MGCFFEGNLFLASEVVVKACEERDQWLTAQAFEAREQDTAMMEELTNYKVWSKPPPRWFKCNVGLSWDKKKKLVGTAWTLEMTMGKLFCIAEEVL